VAASEYQYRSFTPDLQVRSGGDGRTIYGIVVPYNAPTRINDQLVETFARGAFNHQLANPNRVRYSREHALLGGELIGAGTLMRDDAAGLYMELRASRTPKGDETLELIKDGALPHLSIMFAERQNRRLSGGITERVKADLGEVASVMQGAYGDLASVSGVRSGDGNSRGASLIDAEEAELRAKAEQFLNGRLPVPKDNDLAVRAVRLGMPLR
jgi:HK97 family phage prohead protease